MPESWRKRTLEELQKRGLLGADLDQDDVIDPGLDITGDRLQVMIRRWSAADCRCDRLRRDVPARSFEAGSIGQFRLRADCRTTCNNLWRRRTFP